MERVDFLVIGAGIAGLSAAIRLADAGSVLVVTKEELAESNTAYAQGGIAVAMGGDEDVALHLEDTMAAGDGLVNREAASVLVAQGQERVLHALNRFTFGPRPGDLAAVQAIGVKRWFDQQLNPASIDDSALEERLAMFPAMKMQEAELKERYPSPQMLRQMIAKNTRPAPAPYSSAPSSRTAQTPIVYRRYSR